MKFITEDDLRDSYKKEPFTTYEIELGARLTPGARQFLADRGINMFGNDFNKSKSTVNGKQSSTLRDRKIHIKKKLLYSKVKSLEALFLLAAEEFLSRDVFFAQHVIKLGKQLSNIRNALEGKTLDENLCCKECAGINTENFCNDIEDGFEVTEFHMQLEKAKEILTLNRLRCSLHEMEPIILELYEDSEENTVCKDVMAQVNQIINCLSQMICAAMGGKECQRK